MSSYSETPRFLAGAICPRCEALDRIKVYSKNGRDFRECVACGFEDEMHFAANARELETRVNAAQEAVPTQVVNIVKMPKK
ncbi:YheV family putative zinc ribbon protein [Gilvimarinus sp. SDUM040013]|uniref:YheV family putative zinc ribbon protein n=1 Tax=Gilvimarinus gilvus TaxID=3058038 RepID=A0ABU4RYZ0_9GAMM|nr:YheV family putative zinc ribbon protein [Gilvimarinus sp. SDUM040013]MDO3387736.1 YheV family putative zinc ribbon protein [Gilvimarinus sp. SDUM040013]MDX6848823.1 YheV family putative zinc ribbon protein [Gilvimarinus sp. SDUM040013]